MSVVVAVVVAVVVVVGLVVGVVEWQNGSPCSAYSVRALFSA